ncbi:unnamed protein product, partial [Brachionus calyciflorus]
MLTVNENIVTKPPQFYNPFYNSQFSTGNLNSILYVNQNSSNFTPNNYTFGTNFQFNNGTNFQLNNNSNVNFNWRDILNPRFNINSLIQNVESIANEAKLVFINEYKSKIGAKSKNNRQKFELLRNEMLKMVFDKIQYTGEPVKFPDRNGAGLAEDLFDLCVSYVEGELKLDMTALNQSNKDCSCDRLFKLCENEFKRARTDCDR